MRQLSTASEAQAIAPEAIMKKVMRRIIPFVFICYVISYIDRVNVGFAALTMNRDLGLTPAQENFWTKEVPSKPTEEPAEIRRLVRTVKKLSGMPAR